MQVLMKLVTTEFSFRLNCVLRNFEQKSHICSFIDSTSHFQIIVRKTGIPAKQNKYESYSALHY